MEPVTPAEYLTNYAPDKVRLVRQGGGTIELKSPRLVGDSVIGYQGKGDSLAVPLTDLLGIQTLKRDTGKSVLLGLGIGAGVVGVAIAVAALTADYDYDFDGCDPDDYYCY